jgi:hypothetical protein
MSDLGRTPALSVRQPWATLIATGRKTIELRQWSTSYRGLLWIHAAKSVSTELLTRFGLEDAFRGGFIGAAQLGACVRMDEARWRGWEARHLAGAEPVAPGPIWGWLISAAVCFREPIPARGQQGLFVPPGDLQLRLAAAFLESGGGVQSNI